MIIYIGTDHKGFKLKEEIRNFLKNKGYEIADLGNVRYDENDDYVDFAVAVSKRIMVDYENSRGILICGSGVGMSVAANKFPRIRAGLVMAPDQAFDAKGDDDMNVLVLASDYTAPDTAKKIIMTWLGTPFKRETKYLRRLEKIDEIEKFVVSRVLDSEISELDS